MGSEHFEQSFTHFFTRLALRVLFYAVLLGGLAFGMLWGAVNYGAEFYDELGPVEILETVFALLSAIIFLFAGRLNRNNQSFAVMVSCFFFCLFIRESDYLLDVLVCRHAWKVLVALVFVCSAFYFAHHFQEIVASILDFVHYSSFGVFMSGLLVLLVFSRLFGYGVFWKEILNVGQYRMVKTIVEEGVEQMGYFLLLISSCEYLYDTRVRRRNLSHE